MTQNKTAQKATTTEKKLKFSPATIKRIAAAAYEATRIYRLSHNLVTIPEWKKATKTQKDVAINAVTAIVKDPKTAAKDLNLENSAGSFEEMPIAEQWGINLFATLVKGYIM